MKFRRVPARGTAEIVPRRISMGKPEGFVPERPEPTGLFRMRGPDAIPPPPPEPVASLSDDAPKPDRPPWLPRKLPAHLIGDRVNVGEYMHWAKRNPQDPHSPITVDEMKTLARQFRSTPRRIATYRGDGSSKKCYKAARDGGTDDVSVRVAPKHYEHWRLVAIPWPEEAKFKSGRAKVRVRKR